MKQRSNWAYLVLGVVGANGCGNTDPAMLWLSKDRSVVDSGTPQTSNEPPGSSEHEGLSTTSSERSEPSTRDGEATSEVSSVSLGMRSETSGWTDGSSSDSSSIDAAESAPSTSTLSPTSEMPANSTDTEASRGDVVTEGDGGTLLTSTNGARCRELIHAVTAASWGSALEPQAFVGGATPLTLCPGEETPQCKATIDGRLQVNGDLGKSDCMLPTICLQEPPVVTAGCSSFLPSDGLTSMWPDLLYEHCCFAGQLEELLGHEDVCSPDTESMRCGSICNTGRCVDSECVDVTPKACDDGKFCNGEEWCQDERNVGCRSGFKDLSDGNACTTDSCDEHAQMTVHAPVSECTSAACESPVKVYVGSAEQDVWEDLTTASIETASLECGGVSSHCGLDAEGRTYVLDVTSGHPVSAPVATGCATYEYTKSVVMVGTIQPQRFAEQCCIDELPFSDGTWSWINVVTEP